MTALLSDGFVSLADDDTPPLFSAKADADKAPDRCGFSGCTEAIVRKSNKGPAPLYCPTHQAMKSKPAGKQAKVSTGSWAMAGQVETVLTTYLNGLGMAVSFVSPRDGEIIVEGCGPVAHEIVELGRQDKKLRSLLEKLATPGKYGPLIMALFPIVVGIAANHGLLPQFTIGAPGKE